MDSFRWLSTKHTYRGANLHRSLVIVALRPTVPSYVVPRLPLVLHTSFWVSLTSHSFSFLFASPPYTIHQRPAAFGFATCVLVELGTWYARRYNLIYHHYRKSCSSRGFHLPIFIIPSNIPVRDAAKPEKRRASEDPVGARPEKRNMTVWIILALKLGLRLTTSIAGRQDAGREPTRDRRSDQERRNR